jgi:class 3 adenylate cyclase
VRERTSVIEAQMDVSDALLRNVLPKDAIEELKATGKTKAQKFEQVTVLMADIKGFTLISEKLTPEELIQKIDLYFRAFDQITTQNGLEKIKTIGDAYMAAGGLGTDALEGVKAAIAAALDMQDFMQQQAATSPEHTISLRIGIHTGTVIAGVVGAKKFQYDIWGDTVNIAARMEQNSEPGRVNVSQVTHDLAGDAFRFQYRGKIGAKNKGELDMYFADHAGIISKTS